MDKRNQEYLVEKIKSQYTEKEYTELDELKALDKKVKTPATLFAYVFGSLAAMIMGAGMSLIMTDVGATVGVSKANLVGLIVGIQGLMMVIADYPIYKRMLNKRRKEYADEIIKLSDKLIK